MQRPDPPVKPVAMTIDTVFGRLPGTAGGEQRLEADSNFPPPRGRPDEQGDYSIMPKQLLPPPGGEGGGQAAMSIRILIGLPRCFTYRGTRTKGSSMQLTPVSSQQLSAVLEGEQGLVTPADLAPPHS